MGIKTDFCVFTKHDGRLVAVKPETVLTVTGHEQGSNVVNAVVTVCVGSVRERVRVRETMDEVLAALTSVGKLTLRYTGPERVDGVEQTFTTPATVPGNDERTEGGA